MPRCYASRPLPELPLQPEIHSSRSFPPFGSRFKDHFAQLAFFERCYGLSSLADRATQLVNFIGHGVVPLAASLGRIVLAFFIPATLFRLPRTPQPRTRLRRALCPVPS